MTIASTEAAVVKDIDSILVTATAAIDKARTFTDAADIKIQAFGKEKLVALAEELTGTGPLAAIVLQLANALDSVVDAVDALADGVAANGKTMVPANPLGVAVVAPSHP
jgi:hypothetical protein